MGTILLEAFEPELENFNDDVRDLVVKVLTAASDHNASSDLFHKGSIIDHTKLTYRILTSMFEEHSEYKGKSRFAEGVYAACILHDLDKYDENNAYKPHHPLLMADRIRKISPTAFAKTVANMVERHEGPFFNKWTLEDGTNVEATAPVSKGDRLLAYANALANISKRYT